MYKTCTCSDHVGDRNVLTTNFFKHKSRPDGLSHVCKACHKIHTMRARSRNIEHVKQVSRLSYDRNRNKRLLSQKHNYNSTKDNVEYMRRRLLSNAKSRAKKHNWEFTITIKDIVIPPVCPVLGIRLERSTGIASDRSPTLDRIDSNQGYILGNVHVISKRANTIKNCGSPEEHRLIYEYFSSSKICM